MNTTRTLNENIREIQKLRQNLVNLMKINGILERKPFTTTITTLNLRNNIIADFIEW